MFPHGHMHSSPGRIDSEVGRARSARDNITIEIAPSHSGPAAETSDLAGSLPSGPHGPRRRPHRLRTWPDRFRTRTLPLPTCPGSLRVVPTQFRLWQNRNWSRPGSYPGCPRRLRVRPLSFPAGRIDCARVRTRCELGRLSFARGRIRSDIEHIVSTQFHIYENVRCTMWHNRCSSLYMLEYGERAARAHVLCTHRPAAPARGSDHAGSVL
jgi:hypothetical protein